ncbi:site-specific recombinase [Neisseria sp. Ec49-e6-T10]|uniref:site-specific recombinase n=1 Tax=Neisseria sp. Ec49-e6-T10 TaxID=3140744 RepID=UPI003EB9C77E
MYTQVESDVNQALTVIQNFISSIRPSSKNIEQASVNLSNIIEQLKEDSEYAHKIRDNILCLLQNTRQIPLFAEQGLLSNNGFFSSLKSRLIRKLLPIPPNNHSLQSVFGQIFNHPDDPIWLSSIDSKLWQKWWLSLRWKNTEESVAPALSYTRQQIMDAILVVCTRISAIGLEPELVRLYPQIEQHESPFLYLNAEVQRYIAHYRNSDQEGTPPEQNDKHIQVLLEQCQDIIDKIHKNAAVYGISINLTYLIVRLEQHLARIHTLLALLRSDQQEASDASKFTIIREFLIELAYAESRKNSISDLSKRNTEIVALRITEHAGRHGEHYIAEDKKQWLKMLKAAMGAGFIIAFMAMFKLGLAHEHLPILTQGLAFGLNYALGFMLIHVLGFTVATKQPAMTAATIAAVIHERKGHNKKAQEENTKNLANLVVKVLHTQFIAVLGNIILAAPVALFIAYVWHILTGTYIAGVPKAQILIAETQPFPGLALFYAAIAGVYLFLSGLIAGYYDNQASYHRLSERIANQPYLNRLMGPKNSQRLGQYLHDHLGGLFSNFYFGMFLGLTGSIGAILGLPLDIRHITFSAANTAYAVYTLDFQLSPMLWTTTILGVLLIGVINLSVSFSLALNVALRARKLPFKQALPILPVILKHLLLRPWALILPPKAEKTEESIPKENKED